MGLIDFGSRTGVGWRGKDRRYVITAPLFITTIWECMWQWVASLLLFLILAQQSGP